MILKYKENIGKAFFIIGILTLLYMIFSPLTKVYVHPDEFFTMGMIKYSFSNVLTATAVDTHPPGHYYILKAVFAALNALNISYDTLFVAKMLSILPYALVLLVSATKVRKQYGWFTAGVFAFAIGVMSGFFIAFLTVRMYNWGLFFLLMTFIYFGEVIRDSSIKSWVLLSVFSALVCYTQYFMAFSLALIYLSLLIYIVWFKRDNFMDEFKKFIGSIVLIILLYAPWIPKFIEQMTMKRGAHSIPPLTLKRILASCVYYLTGNEYLLIQIFAAAVTLILLILVLRRFYSERSSESYYVASGFFIFFGTILITIIVSMIYQPILLNRYIVPVAAIIWLSISILLGKIDNNRIFMLALIFLIVFGFSGFVDINSDTATKLESGTKWMDMFNDINKDSNAIVVYDGGMGVFEFETFLGDVKSYSPPIPSILGVNTSVVHGMYDFEEKSPEELTEMVNTTDKKVYYVHAWGNFELNDTDLKQIGKIAGAKFYYVK